MLALAIVNATRRWEALAPANENRSCVFWKATEEIGEYLIEKGRRMQNQARIDGDIKEKVSELPVTLNLIFDVVFVK